MLLGTINLLPGFCLSVFECFVVLNCQVVEWVDILANPVFKNPGIFIIWLNLFWPRDWSMFGPKRTVRTIILTLIGHFAAPNI